LTETVAKCSAGAIFNILVAKIKSISNTIEFLKKQGIWIIGLDPSGEIYHKIDFKIPLCIVVGGEGKGLNSSTKKKCDFLARIPMFGKISSLNVSVAAGIIFYEVIRQRHLNA
jgi:23S rRNA (guanosine2251-2'-O)-methyltransferase